MSELIEARDHRSSIRWQLLTSVSAFSLVMYVAATTVGMADDADRPTVWLEMGGQMESLQGNSSPFTAPFMTVTPTPDPYRNDFFSNAQRPAHHSFGLEGGITLQPHYSDWTFSAHIRYGRSNNSRHVHNQTALPTIAKTFYYYGNTYNYHFNIPFAKVADVRAHSSESHMVLDFSAGRDIGIGILGSNSTSAIAAGIRYAQFSITSTVAAYARPDISIAYPSYFHVHPYAGFNQYFMNAHSSRSFTGVGPSLSWNASAALAGDPASGELTVDWGINAALLFGRQKVETSHGTHAYQLTRENRGTYYNVLYPTQPHHSIRSRSVATPNFGGFAGFSVKYVSAKVSLGYRADFFFGAIDAGIDTRQAKDLGFNGPFASISIGLGG